VCTLPLASFVRTVVYRARRRTTPAMFCLQTNMSVAYCRTLRTILQNYKNLCVTDGQDARDGATESSR